MRNMLTKKLLENQFKGVSVLGEISNIARPSSGHIYFTLKDEDGAIRCAMFRSQNLRLNFEPQNGDQCVLKGQISLYAPRGDYQLIVSSMQPAGAGNLMHQFEELKKKLEDKYKKEKERKQNRNNKRREQEQAAKTDEKETASQNNESAEEKKPVEDNKEA